jgi:hypothetical protein
MIRALRIASAMLLLAAAAACSKAQARVPVPVTALDTPAPPERVLIPVVLNAPVEPPPAEPEPEPETPPPTRPRPSAANTSRPPASPEAAPAPGAPAQPVLRTTTDVGAAEERIRTFIAEAEQNLNRLRVNELSAQARAHYDAARGFIRQANDALRVKNYMHAETLAKNAAVLAGQLVKG